MNIIPRDDITSLVEHCRIAKAEYPQIFVRNIKANGFPMKLDANGEKIKKDVDPVLPIRTLWILPKEKVCHRCGHEYEDIPGEAKEKICPKCMEKFEHIRDMNTALPGYLPMRESAVKTVEKPYLDQARALTGIFPVRFRNFINEDGLKLISKVMKGIDSGHFDTGNSVRVADVGDSKATSEVGVQKQAVTLVRMPRRTMAKSAIDVSKVSLHRICELAWINPVEKAEYRPDFLPCERPVV